MFVQTHFQRARLQASSQAANLSAASWAQPHAHSSVAPHRPSKGLVNLHDRGYNGAAVVNREHKRAGQASTICRGQQSGERSPLSPRPRASSDQRAPAIKGAGQKIKAKIQQPPSPQLPPPQQRPRSRSSHHHHGMLAKGAHGVSASDQGSRDLTRETRPPPARPGHNQRHAHLRRTSEFDEGGGPSQEDAQSRQLRDNIADQQLAQMSWTRHGTQTHTPSGGHWRVGGAATTVDSSTTLRLRSCSSSGRGRALQPSGEPLSQIKARRLCSRIHRWGSRGSDRLSLGKSASRSLGSRPKYAWHSDCQLEEILAQLIRPFVNVSPSLCSDRLTRRAPRPVGRGDGQRGFDSFSKLLAPIAQTLHCLALFLVNFLQFQLQTLRHTFVRNIRALCDHIEGPARESAHLGATMRAQQRRHRPGPGTAAGARSFDADRLACRGEASQATNSAAALYRRLQLQHQQQTLPHAPLIWIATTDLGQPLAHADGLPPGPVGGGHTHRHNHGPGFRLTARPSELLVPGTHETLVGELNHLVPLSFHRSLDHETHGQLPYDVRAEPPFPVRLLGASSRRVSQAARAPNPGTSEIWRMHMAHTLDACCSHEREAQAPNRAPSGPSACSASFDQPNYEAPRAMYPRHEATSSSTFERFGMPPRQRLTSISSPTLSDYENPEHQWHQQPEVDPPSLVSRRSDRVLPAWPGQSGVGAEQRPFRRRLPQPPLLSSQSTRSEAQYDGALQKLTDRRLSSIMGSDSELYAKRPLPNAANFNSPSSSSASSRARTNRLARYQPAERRAGGSYIHQQRQQAPPPSSSTVRERRQVPSSAERRRFARQTSSTSAASQSGATTTAGARGTLGSNSRTDRTARLAHQFRSLQVDPVQQRQHKSYQSAGGGPQHSRRQSKSDTESRSATSRRSREVEPHRQNRDHHNHQPQPKQHDSTSGGQSDHLSDAQPNGQLTSAPRRDESARAKSLALGGKSKSMSHHASPISVIGKAVSLAGAKRRLGFKQKGGLSSLSVHRSEEVFPGRQPRTMGAFSADTTASNSLNSDSCDGSAGVAGGGGGEPTSSSSCAAKWLRQFGSSSPDPKVCFVEGLGAGQIASRQALVSPYLGDVQVSLSDRRGMLEVEIIRVRQLQPKPGAKRLPSPYVKVYLMREKKCAAKFKTNQAQQTLDPLYQQLFIFRDDYSNCVLQIIVWADYGKKDRKSLMGIVQIHLDDLDMSEMVIGWYKLFNAPSMVAATLSGGPPPVASVSSKALRQTLSSTKLGDLATIQNQQEPVADFGAPLVARKVKSAK